MPESSQPLDVGFIIKLLHDVIGRNVNRELETQQLTNSQMSVLLYLHSRENADVSIRDIQGFLNVSHPTAAGLVRRLNKKGFVELLMDVFAVGDCYSPSTIANAVARANIVARNIEKQQQTAAVLTGDHVYTATVTGIGDVTVSIRVEGGQITEALVDTSNEMKGIGRELGEQFAREIVEKHSIDAVSGATVTTNAANEALVQCLKQAGL